MKHPSKIIDLHTHLFNARYVPLAGIIAHAMNKNDSALASAAAALLNALTGSSYDSGALVPVPSDPDEQEAYFLDQYWAITEYELHTPTEAVEQVAGVGAAVPFVPGLDGSARLLPLIAALSVVDYAAEGWKGELPPQLPVQKSALALMGPADFLPIARKIVRIAIKAVTSLMDPKMWGRNENYLEFFLTMLKSEQALADKLVSEYGRLQAPLRVAHFMMDMQKGFKQAKSPHYAFHPEQHRHMEQLARDNNDLVFGFSAFDPHRGNWEEHALYAIEHGFVGFKFYPAMGYTPSGDGQFQDRIDAFFDFCVKHHAPIFVHCTPQGFQTREQLGWNAHPKHWRTVLDNPRWSTLRLCFGHAGGGESVNSQNSQEVSHGWTASTPEAWEDEDNFARLVVELCVSHRNVYCELGYITELFERGDQPAFIHNFKEAAAATGKYWFMDKVAYGSDWHMPSMVDSVRDYYNFFLALMQQDYFAPYIDKFFWQNAVRYAPLLGKGWGPLKDELEERPGPFRPRQA
ncbi:MAG: hypothetical protein V4723_07330 [Pseudomonadota bacterium]